jgi:hypothetical protein
MALLPKNYTEMALLPAGKVPGTTPYVTEGVGQSVAN